MNYLDFDVLIERVGTAYRAKVMKSPVGEALSKKFAMPFSELELENFLLKIGLSQRNVRRVESPEMDAAKKFGARLFDTVFEGQVQSRLLSSIDMARTQNAGLRIRLRLTDAPKLSGLPWEYLYNSTVNSFLALSDSTPIVRYLDIPGYIAPLKVNHPLRVLVMIASPSDYPKLDVEREWNSLHEALFDLEQGNLVKLERLNKPTMAALRRRLQQPGDGYHVFHFIGHGDFDAQTQDGLLLFEDDHERSHRISGQTLSVLLHNHEQLRLVVLNACGGARGSADDPFTGTAQGIIQQGIPAVIAMQFDITDQAAICFSHEFYMALADGSSVDAAMTAARIAMYTDGFSMEWGTPVLFLHSSDGCVFDVDPLARDAAGEQGAPILAKGVDSPAENQTQPRTSIPLAMLSPPGGPIESHSRFYIERAADLIVTEIEKLEKGVTLAIKGPRQVGKTSLLLRTTEAAAKVGKNLALIDFQEIDDAYFDNAEGFFRNFCEMISSELKIENRVAEYWDNQPIIQRCTRYVGDYVLKESGPLVLALDEMERIFDTSFRSDFFGMLRGWHNRRARFTTPIWKQLDMVIVTSTEPHYFIKNLAQSPFNVATKVLLGEFTPDQVKELNKRYGSPLNDEDVASLLAQTAGHPYLTHFAIYLVASKRNSASDLLLSVVDRNNPFREYLLNLALRLQNEPDMLKSLRSALREKNYDDLEGLFRLEGAGLIRQEGQRVLPRCQLYESFFKEYLNV